MIIVSLVGFHVAALHLDREGGFDCKDFSQDITVSSCVVLNGEWRYVGKMGENTGVVHVAN